MLYWVDKNKQNKRISIRINLIFL